MDRFFVLLLFVFWGCAEPMPSYPEQVVALKREAQYDAAKYAFYRMHTGCRGYLEGTKDTFLLLGADIALYKITQHHDTIEYALALEKDGKRLLPILDKYWCTDFAIFGFKGWQTSPLYSLVGCEAKMDYTDSMEFYREVVDNERIMAVLNSHEVENAWLLQYAKWEKKNNLKGSIQINH